MTAANLIKHLDQPTYSEFVIESLLDNKSPEHKDLHSFTNKMKPPGYMNNVLKGLEKVSQLSNTHPVKKLVMKRKIPSHYHHKLFSCPNFMEFTNNIIAGKFDEKALKYDGTRLLIPFISSTGDVHAYQGRAIDPKDTVRYITIIINETFPKVYGLDTVNFNLPVPVFEGPIDSMFIGNSIATAGGDFGAIYKMDRSKLILVFDNEPRSIYTVKKVDSAINQGYTVCIWPDNIHEKDVNDMILVGRTKEFIEHTILDTACSGLKAKLELSRWSKV